MLLLTCNLAVIHLSNIGEEVRCARSSDCGEYQARSDGECVGDDSPITL